MLRARIPSDILWRSALQSTKVIAGFEKTGGEWCWDFKLLQVRLSLG